LVGHSNHPLRRRTERDHMQNKDSRKGFVGSPTSSSCWIQVAQGILAAAQRYAVGDLSHIPKVQAHPSQLDVALAPCARRGPGYGRTWPPKTLVASWGSMPFGRLGAGARNIHERTQFFAWREKQCPGGRASLVGVGGSDNLRHGLGGGRRAQVSCPFLGRDASALNETRNQDDLTLLWQW